MKLAKLKFGKSKLLKSSKLTDKDPIKFEAPTDVPVLNIALSGRLDGGVKEGLTQIVGPSKHFKTLLGLFMAKAYMDKFPEAEMIFYDSERGAGINYFKSVGIDVERVARFEVDFVENLKFDLSQKLEQINEEYQKTGEPVRVVVFIDSVGMLPSKKEVEDAIDANAVSDMTRAKALKSFARVTVNRAANLGIPIIVINHVYAGMSQYAPDVVSGGTGLYLASEDIIAIGRSKVKAKDGSHAGYTFKLRLEKSRACREGAVLPLTVTFDEGIDKYTGLFEIAKATGDIYAPTKGWWSRKFSDGSEDKKWRISEIENNQEEFFEGLIEKTDFKKAIAKFYTYGDKALVKK